MEEKGFIEPVEGSNSRFTSDHQLTQAGKDYASTPEYEEYLREMNFQPSTNEEHQERIKKRLLNKTAVQIFDLLMKYGSLTRKELATIVGMNDRSHPVQLWTEGYQGERSCCCRYCCWERKTSSL